MRKIAFVCLLAFVAFPANAQLLLGGSFSINFSNEHTAFKSTSRSLDKEKEYLISLMPKIYWNINEKMQVGGRVGFGFGRLSTGMVYESDKKEEADLVNRAVGWSLCPFYGYRLLDWGAVSVWAEANVFVGQSYNVNQPKYGSLEWGLRSEYGFQILPVINIGLKEKLALQLHLGFVSVGWYGTRADYPEMVVTTSSWDLHKGGFAGLLQGLTDYGICIVRQL